MANQFKSLRQFVAVAEAGSVGKAARLLHMAQPPLSVHIRNLESQVGAALFVRERDGMRLTDAGSALLVRAREALALADDGIEAARAIAAGRRGRLSVGCMFSLGYAVLPTLVPLLRRRLPAVELQFVEMSALTCEAQLVDRRVAVGLCMPPPAAPALASTPVGREPLRLALQSGSPLARLASVPIARLQGLPLIGLPSMAGEPEHSLVAAMLRRHGVTMQVVERAETVHGALALVLAGEGLAIVPACVGAGMPRGIVLRPFRDSDDGFDVVACWRRDFRSALIEPFVEAARHCYRGRRGA